MLSRKVEMNHASPPNIITRLVYQKRNKQRVSVFLDDEYAFSLPDTLASTLSLGQHLSDEDIAQLRNQDDRQRAMDKAFRLLARRPRSEHEIIDALHKADFAPDICAHVVARLREMSYLDDQAFAHWWVDNRNRFNPRSARALQQELYQKGVARTLIDEVLLEVDEQRLAHAAGKKRAYRWRHLPRAEFAQKMLGYLQRRGFSYSIARTTCNHLWEQLISETD